MEMILIFLLLASQDALPWEDVSIEENPRRRRRELLSSPMQCSLFYGTCEWVSNDFNTPLIIVTIRNKNQRKILLYRGIILTMSKL